MRSNVQKFWLTSFALWATLAASCPLAQSANPEDYEGSGSSLAYGGALLGIGVGNNATGTNLAFGINAGHKILPDIGVGGYLSYVGLGTTTVISPLTPTLNTSYSSSLVTIAAAGDYFLDDALPGLYAGLRGGLGLISTSEPSVSGGTHLTLGPAIGYNYALGSGLTLGGEFNFLSYTTSPLLHIFNLLATVRYWF